MNEKRMTEQQKKLAGDLSSSHHFTRGFCVGLLGGKENENCYISGSIYAAEWLRGHRAGVSIRKDICLGAVERILALN